MELDKTGNKGLDINMIIFVLTKPWDSFFLDNKLSKIAKYFFYVPK